MLIVADPADQGTVVEVVLPGEGAPWREVMLPFQWSRKGGDRPGLAWFRVELEVSDTPHADPARPGRGLSGMRRRAARIGAELEIASGASGTRITLAYPLMPDA